MSLKVSVREQKIQKYLSLLLTVRRPKEYDTKFQGGRGQFHLERKQTISL